MRQGNIKHIFLHAANFIQGPIPLLDDPWRRVDVVSVLPPSSLLDFNLYPLSLIHFTHLLQLVTELCIFKRSSRGEDWYNINPLPRIIKQRDWALNEGWCVEEYMFILTLSHMCMTLFLLGVELIVPRLGRGGWARNPPPPSLLSWI